VGGARGGWPGVLRGQRERDGGQSFGQAGPHRCQHPWDTRIPGLLLLCLPGEGCIYELREAEVNVRETYHGLEASHARPYRVEL